VSALEGAILGLVQGLTEFLPVSSSGHLVIGQTLFGLDGSHLAFDVVVHGATLVAIVFYFRDRLLELLRRRDWGYAGRIALGTLPVVVAGFSFRAAIGRAFADPALVVVTLTGTGLMLLSLFLRPGRLARGEAAGEAVPSWGAAWWIGCAQAVSLIPGISRSGATITTAMWLGVAPSAAAEFSFLLGIPAIAGAVTLQLGAIAHAAGTAAQAGTMALGALTAFASGVTAIVLVFRFLARRAFPLFGFYCLAVAAAFGAWLHLAG